MYATHCMLTNCHLLSVMFRVNWAVEGFPALHCVQHVGQWQLGALTLYVVVGNHKEVPRSDCQQVLHSHNPRQSMVQGWVEAFSLYLKSIVFSKNVT